MDAQETQQRYLAALRSTQGLTDATAWRHGQLLQILYARDPQFFADCCAADLGVTLYRAVVLQLAGAMGENPYVLTDRLKALAGD